MFDPNAGTGSGNTGTETISGSGGGAGGIIGGIVGVLVVGGIIAGVVVWKRKQGKDDGISTPRAAQKPSKQD